MPPFMVLKEVKASASTSELTQESSPPSTAPIAVISPVFAVDFAPSPNLCPYRPHVAQHLFGQPLVRCEVSSSQIGGASAVKSPVCRLMTLKQSYSNSGFRQFSYRSPMVPPLFPCGVDRWDFEFHPWRAGPDPPEMTSSPGNFLLTEWPSRNAYGPRISQSLVTADPHSPPA